MNKVTNLAKEYSIVLVLIALIIVMCVARPDAFPTWTNVFTVLRQASIAGIMSIGLLFVMVAGGLDLSIGSMVSFTGVLSAFFMVRMEINPALAIVLVIVIAAAVGLAQGFVIVRTGIYPMIGTLAMLTILGGIAFLICGGPPITGTPASMKMLAQGYVGVVPVPVIMLAVVVAIAAFVLNKTYLGRQFYLVGANTEAARLSGLNTKRIQIISYGICAALCGFAGIIMLSRTSSGHPQSGLNMEMEVLTALVIGGVSLTGGEGKVLKAISGVLLMAVLMNGMTILNITEYWQMVVRGGVFLFAVCADGIQKQFIRREKTVALA